MTKLKKCDCGETDHDNFYYGCAAICKKCKIEKSTLTRSYKTKKELFEINLENNILRYKSELSKLSSDKKLIEEITEFVLNNIVSCTIEETFIKK